MQDPPIPSSIHYTHTHWGEEIKKPPSEGSLTRRLVFFFLPPPLSLASCPMKKLREHSRAEVASCCPLFFSFLLSFLFCFFPSPAKAPLAIHVILLLLLFLVDAGTLGEERTITAARLSGGESEGANGNADESAIVPQSLPRCRCRRSLALSRSPLFICFFFTVRLSPRPASTHSDYSH